MKRLSLKNQRGMILLVFILTLPFLILIATYYLRLSLTSFQVARLDQLHTEAQLAADAGADYAVEQISQDNTWAGTGGEVQLHVDSKLKTTFEASLVTDTSSLKTVAITGRTYWPVNASSATRSVTVYIDLHPVTTGAFSIVSGEGGLIMSNSSKIVGGSVFINGEVSLSNTSQIGLSTKPVNVQVAHQACPDPPDSTFPRVCASGEKGQPITINGPSAHIYGTVKATNQTDGTGMSNPGLVTGSVSPQALPSYDRSAQKSAAINDMTGSAASCSGIQTRTWPANTKITGNVNVDTQCKVTVMGDVWITGSLTVSNSAQLIVSNTLGTTQPVIMVDGSGGVALNQSAQLVSNINSTGFEVITFWSTAGCSPDCSDVTGVDLASSRSVVTMALNQSSSAPNTIFYAYWSEVSVGNSGQIGALIGQTVNLNNNSAITFGSSVSTGSVTWVVDGYRRH
jgi:Tfp pilus assembly protein PilX